MEKLIKLVIAPVLVGILVLLACESKIFYSDDDCDYCYTDKPKDVELIFHWSEEFDSIVVNINKGTMEEGEYIGSWVLYSNPAYVIVEYGEEFSCEARYDRDSKTYWVVDGTKPKLKKIADYCAQGDCWIIENADLYIELNY